MNHGGRVCILGCGAFSGDDAEAAHRDIGNMLLFLSQEYGPLSCHSDLGAYSEEMMQAGISFLREKYKISVEDQKSYWKGEMTARLESLSELANTILGITINENFTRYSYYKALPLEEYIPISTAIPDLNVCLLTYKLGNTAQEAVMKKIKRLLLVRQFRLIEVAV